MLLVDGFALINNLLTTTFILFALSACSSSVVPSKVGPNGEYIGWHCSGDIASEGNWHCEEKVLKDGQVVTEVGPTAVAKVETEQASEISADRQVPDEVESTQQKQTVAEKTAVDTKSSYPTTGYSLQLGAYRNRQQAEQAAENMLLSGPVEIRDIISQGKPFSVILLGHYATRSEAESAAQYLTINYWIRSMRSLADARAD